MSKSEIKNRSRVADHVRGIPPSGIRKFFEMVIGMDDVISLGVGEPDFHTPRHVRDYAIQILDQGRTSYTSNYGLLELRQAIADYLRTGFDVEYDPVSEVLVTVGGSEAIDLCFRAILNPGDEAIIVEPCYVSYAPSVVLAGGKPISFATYQEYNFRIDFDQLRKTITPRTRAILVTYPSNPTGATFRREDLQKLAAIALEFDILVITDEIYAELTYDFRHTSLASLPGMKDHVLLVSGMSKAFAMTGWRVGYVCGPEEIVSALVKIHQYGIMCAPTVSQYASIEALRNGQESVAAMRMEYDTRRKLIVRRFNELGMKCLMPEGAFYAFASIKHLGVKADDFCRGLLQAEKVAIVPGNAFGDSGEGMVRASYATALPKIELAMDKLGQYLERGCK